MHPVLKDAGVVHIWYYIPLCTIFAKQSNGDVFRTQFYDLKSRSQNPSPFSKQDSSAHQYGNPWQISDDHFRTPTTCPCRNWVGNSFRIIPRAILREKNPVSKRGKRTLLKKIRVLLANYQVAHNWWGEAFSMAIYVLNTTPISNLGFQAHISKCKYLASLKLNHLHLFWCTAVIQIPNAKRVSKVYATGSLFMFLGVTKQHHNFCLFYPKAKRIIITNDFTFKEGESFWPSHSSVPNPSLSLSSSKYLLCFADPTVQPISGISDISSFPVLINKEELVADIVSEVPQAQSFLSSFSNVLARDSIRDISGGQPSEKSLPKGGVY
ncbi:hypothetical protein O181_070655 [Austropuccinia psidii MF-1]|uniref:Retroviral polymerase SH3-like domain-containing protein n=1 Tax=Austropuccinia psidii MF-1 TaxID=1389203 RepID=A0A9Q3EWX1_9BASI|nr:hypothetical protein [Austropuccinia psidii MF-1]